MREKEEEVEEGSALTPPLLLSRGPQPLSRLPPTENRRCQTQSRGCQESEVQPLTGNKAPEGDKERERAAGAQAEVPVQCPGK